MAKKMYVGVNVLTHIFFALILRRSVQTTQRENRLEDEMAVLVDQLSIQQDLRILA
jgi:spermidine synthase